MAEFDDLREALTASRRARDRQRQAVLLANEAVRQAERALAESARTKDPQDEQAPRPEEEALRDALERAKTAAAELTELHTAENELLQRFEGFSDPRDGVARWPDQFPILLLPLRIETRFRTGEDEQPQLWVRVYPDSCVVDSFEASLTTLEVENARVFWAAVWRAGGDEALERAAWRELVAAHGSGRSGWIVRQYQPLNPLDKPVKDDPGEVLLIIVAAAELPAAAAVFWEAMWRAHGDAGAQQAALAALEAAVGAAQARELAATTRPVNLDDPPTPPLTHADAPVTVAVLQLPPPEDVPTRRTSWSSAPRVDLLPERFVLVGDGPGEPLVAVGRQVRTPLLVGPDPNAPPDQQLRPVDDTLQIPDELAWMFDFERALEAGMALRVDLTAQQAAEGFKRLVVLGVRLSDSPDEGRQRLERLLEHHLYSRSGLELLRQGTPTNNTEKGGAGYSFRDDPDATFDVFFLQTPQYGLERDVLLRRDGQWLADTVGLGHDLVRRIPGAGGRDQAEARAMQIALWPGTLGYMLRTLLAPVFSDDQIAATRLFFTRYVSGRGPVPALRIGAQPYGILPATAFSRLAGAGLGEPGGHLQQLLAIVNRIEEDWAPLVAAVSHLGQRDRDPHQLLLDVLGLHPSSVEYYPLQGESVEHKFYELAFLDFSVSQELLGLLPAVIPLTLLRGFGYQGEQVPALLRQIYRARQTPLNGPVIDDRPLSEEAPIRGYAGDRNYLQWLVDAAGAGIEQVQQEQGFDDDTKPAALLYLFARHALQLGFHSTGVRLQAAAGMPQDPAAAAQEPSFVHVREARAGSESRYDALFRTAAPVTGSEAVLLGDYIAANVRAVDHELREQVEALERLSLLPTARLERLFAEHIDTVSYRLDTWKTGLVAMQLERLRSRQRQEGPELGAAGEGLFLGAYGWLEPVRPGNKVLTPAELPEDLAAEVNRRDDAPLLRDSTNQGLVHGPSLNHATTAAVLRNGYVANDGRLAVNLTSRRVRLALGIQEGMRAGQSLGALLGYRFERHVHDHGPLQVRDLVYYLRRAFPLAADQIQATRTSGGEAKESIAAMNVVDGRKLIEHVERTGERTYPFGMAALPRRAAEQEEAVTEALAHIRDVNDALADLVLAEGVYQAVLGNFERSAGTLDAVAKQGGYPPEPEVVRTPRSGIALTSRTAVHLSPAPPANPLPPLPLTPLAAAEPALNAWLAGWLPAPADVGCLVTFTDRGSGTEQTEFFSQAQLGLHPIDLLYRVDTSTDPALTELEDRILELLHGQRAPRHDREIRIRSTERVPDKVTWFELEALLRSLRALTVAARPLQPADLMRHNDATRAEQATATLPPSRVERPRDDLRDVHLPALDTLTAALADATVTVDEALAGYAEVVGRIAAYRLPQTGTGFVHEWRAGAYHAVTGRVADRVGVWDARLADYDQRIDQFDNQLPPGTSEQDRIALLQAAESLVSARLTTPVPATSAAYRLALDARRTAFVGKRDALQDLVDTARPTLTQLLDDAENELPLSEFDTEPFDFTADAKEIARFRAELAGAVARLKDDLTDRIRMVDAILADHAAAGQADKVRLLQQAARIIFGEDFQLIPLITLSAAAADELANAWQHSVSGDLTRHLTDPAGPARDFPVDDWLHGVARVRDKLHHWENVVLLGQAFGVASTGDLTPLQLPHGPDEPWLALEIPDGYRIDSDRLLYTAHFAQPFDKTAPVCGLLVDEWTEVVPGTEETTGIAFHLDRPNAEPPQAWLLALAPGGEGQWRWEDLLAAVNDTFDSAKRRAIEPVHLDATAYSWFLPATVSAYTFPEISISNNLLRNVRIYSKLAED